MTESTLDKLERLLAAGTPGSSWELYVAVVNALPKLIAVVRAAEDLKKVMPEYMHGGVLYEALAALDEGE